MSAVAIRNETAPADRFDYSAVDKATASEARALAERVRSFERRLTNEALDLGSALLRTKDRLGHGQFLPWLTAEFGEKIVRTAQRWMVMAEAFGPKNDNLSYLPPSTLSALAAPATPVVMRDEIVNEIKAGRQLTSPEILERVRTAQAEAREAARLAKLSPEERKKLATKAKRSKTDRERREIEWRAEQQENERLRKLKANNAAKAAALIASRLSSKEVHEIAELLTDPGGNSYWQSDLRNHLAALAGLEVHGSWKSEHADLMKIVVEASSPGNP